MNILGDIVSGKNTPQVKKQLVQPTQNKIVFFPNNDTERLRLLSTITKNQRSLYNKLISELSSKSLRAFIIDLLKKKHNNRRLQKFLNNHKLTLNTIQNIPTTALKTLMTKTPTSFTALTSTSTGVEDNLAIGYGNFSQRQWSPVGESRLILGKVPNPVKLQLDSFSNVYGDLSYGQGSDNGVQSYSSYLDIPMGIQTTTISFDMDLKYSRPGVVTSIYSVPMGMHWTDIGPSGHTSYTTYKDYNDEPMTFNTITNGIGGWYDGITGDDEKLTLIKKLAPEYGFGYNDSHGLGQGYSHQINFIEATPTGIQVSLHGALIDKDNYILNNSGTKITDDLGNFINFKDIESSTDPNYKKLCYDQNGVYCNIHGAYGRDDGKTGGYGVDLKYSTDGSTYSPYRGADLLRSNDPTTNGQMYTYGPSNGDRKFDIDSLKPFDVTNIVKYNNNYEVILTTIIHQFNNDKDNYFKFELSSRGFSRKLGLDKMNLVTSYWSPGKKGVSSINNKSDYQNHTTWWLDGINMDPPIIAGESQPIRGLSTIPNLYTQANLGNSWSHYNQEMVNIASGNLDPISNTNISSTNTTRLLPVYTDYNEYAVPVHNAIVNNIRNVTNLFGNNNISNFVPSICVISNLHITNDDIIDITPDLKVLPAWKLDIMNTGLKDAKDADGKDIDVSTYWGGRHNGAYQMSYSTTKKIDTVTKGFINTYICNVNSDEDINQACAANCAKYALEHCTVAKWMASDSKDPPVPPAPVYNVDNTEPTQYDFAKTILGMNTIRQKECMDTDDNGAGTSNNYVLQAKYGLNIFEAPGISVNGNQFSSSTAKSITKL